MSNYAVYRCLYGEDFVQESIQSISDYVDKIFVFWDDTPWGNVDQCLYKGKVVKFPKQFDNILDKIKDLNNPKVQLIYDHKTNNVSQFTDLINDIILPNYPRPELFIIPEIDHVFRRSELEKTIQLMHNSQIACATTRVVELWKSYAYRIPERRRVATVLWNMKYIDKLPFTGRQADITDMRILPTSVHNFGFCFNEKTMYWKHMIALAMAQAIGDCPPNELWYDKWLNWSLENNNSCLEISLGQEHMIPFAYVYDRDFLPEEIKRKYQIK